MTAGESKPFATRLPKDLQGELRSTVAGLQRRFGQEVTMGRFVADALTEAIRKAEVEHNEGKPFDEAVGGLPRGARIASGRSPGGGDES